jgi:orotate phosphoribosyltransferase
MTNSTKAALKTLLASRSVLPGPIVLSNGSFSDYYFDCKRVTLDSEGSSLVGEAILDEIEKLPDCPTAIGGLTHGADPIIGAVVMRARDRGMRISGFYVRKEPKKHGTQKFVENAPPPGTNVVIVDDVVTAGGSVLKAVEGAEREGCRVVAVMTLVDRLEGGTERIRARVKRYIPLFTLEDFRFDIERVTCRSKTKSETPSVGAFQ